MESESGLSEHWALKKTMGDKGSCGGGGGIFCHIYLRPGAQDWICQWVQAMRKLAKAMRKVTVSWPNDQEWETRKAQITTQLQPKTT